MAGGAGGGASAATLHAGSREAKHALKELLNTWKNPPMRKGWMLIGAKPVMVGCKQAELQAILANKVRVAEEFAKQLTHMAGSDVGAYMPDGPWVHPLRGLNIVEQMEIMVDVIVTIVGKGADTEASKGRVAALHKGLHDGLETLQGHASL